MPPSIATSMDPPSTSTPARGRNVSFRLDRREPPPPPPQSPYGVIPMPPNLSLTPRETPSNVKPPRPNLRKPVPGRSIATSSPRNQPKQHLAGQPAPVTPTGVTARASSPPPPVSAGLFVGSNSPLPPVTHTPTPVTPTGESQPITPSPPRNQSEALTNSPVARNPFVVSDQLRKPAQDGDEWRKQGKVYRAQLVLEDEEKGGNSFVLSDDCAIDRYYRVADRVLDQFMSTSIEQSHELTDSYLVGNRLVKFLSVVLPAHKEYFSPDPRLQVLRKHSQTQLVDLLQYLEDLALLIDEIQYNKQILQGLTPEEKILVGKLTGPDSDLDATSLSMSTITGLGSAILPDEDASTVFLDPTLPSLDGDTTVSTLSIREQKLHERVARVIQETEAGSKKRAGDQNPTMPSLNPHGNAETSVPVNQPTIAQTTPLNFMPNSSPAEPRTPPRQALETSQNDKLPPPRSISPELQMDMSWDASFSDFDKKLMDEGSVSSSLWGSTHSKEQPSLLAGTNFLDQAHEFEDKNESQEEAFFLSTAAGATAGTPTSEGGHSMPVIRQPRAVPPRSVRAKAAAIAEFKDTKHHGPDKLLSPSQRKGVTWVDLDDENSIEDKGDVYSPDKTMPRKTRRSRQSPVLKTKIEERMERCAQGQQDELDRLVMEPHGLQTVREDQLDAEEIVPANRKILRHFKGCIRCLLD